MVRLRKRVTRKDLRQPDSFITFTSRFVEFFKENRRWIVAVAAACVVLVLALLGWNQFRERQDRLASEAYSRALRAYQREDYETALHNLEEVVGYRWSRYRPLGMLYTAQAYLHLQKPAEAVSVLENLLDASLDSYLRQLALFTLGHAKALEDGCSQATGPFAEAARMEGPLGGEALLGKARCNAESGATKEAVEDYRDYLRRYPESDRATEISLRIQELDAKMKGVAKEEQ